MMWRATMAAALLGLAGCGAAEPPRTAAGTEPATPGAAATAPAGEARLDPAATPFYVGRWAAKPSLCADGAWMIDRRGITTAGEVSCVFDRAPSGAGPVEADATCTAEGPPQRHRLKISYAQSARALLVEGGPFAPIGLIRCPADAAS